MDSREATSIAEGLIPSNSKVEINVAGGDFVTTSEHAIAALALSILESDFHLKIDNCWLLVISFDSGDHYRFHVSQLPCA